MKFRFSLCAALAAGPVALFAQAPPAPPTLIPPTPAPPALENKAADPAKAGAGDVDPAVIETLRKAFATQRTKGTFRARMESTGLGAEAMPTVEIEFVFPDSIRMKMAGVEVVGVGEKTMMRIGEGWMPAPASLSSVSAHLGDQRKVDEMLANTFYAKRLGPSKIAGAAVDVYETHTNSKEGLSNSKIYLTPNDLLIQRIETEAEIMGKPATSTLDFFDYGDRILIELPK
jgi:hypothetical protein